MDAFKIAVSAETGKLARFIFLNHDYLSLSIPSILCYPRCRSQSSPIADTRGLRLSSLCR